MTIPRLPGAPRRPGLVARRRAPGPRGTALARAVRITTALLVTAAMTLPVGAVWARTVEAQSPSPAPANSSLVTSVIATPAASPDTLPANEVGGARLGSAADPSPAGTLEVRTSTSLAGASPSSLERTHAAPTPDPTPTAQGLSSTATSATPTAPPAPAATSPPTPASPSPTPPVPSVSPAPSATAAGQWVMVVDDQFNSGGVPAHWSLYDGPYDSNSRNCAAPSQVSVSRGLLNMRMSYRTTGDCGPGWYTAGMSLSGYSSVDQRTTLRFRVVNTSDGAFHSHLIVPMRWPDGDASWPQAGEEDYFEGSWQSTFNSYLHHGTSDAQVASPDYHVDVTQWHTIQTTRLDHVITVAIDGTVVWRYVGNSTTLPDTLKHVVLQQECSANGCPSGTSGTEDLQIDWITVENPG